METTVDNYEERLKEYYLHVENKSPHEGKETE